MNKKYLIVLVLCFLSLFMLSNITNINAQTTIDQSKEQVEINYFYSPGCSACAQMELFLDNLKEKYDDVILNKYNLQRERKLFEDLIKEYKVPEDRVGYIPTVFIEEDYFVGYERQITNYIEYIVATKLGIDFDPEGPQKPEDFEELEKTRVQTSILGIWDVDVGFEDKSIFFATIILGFLDSLNVCSITVLLFLIIYMLSIGSFKKTLKIGLVFVAVIYIFYFLAVLMLTSLLSIFVLRYGLMIRIILSIIAGLVGLILIKDFFFYGKGISLEIPKFAKPILEKYLKKATIVSTIMFALLASLVELPCTAIFPLIFSTILAESGIVGVSRLLWIALYNLVYVIPLLVIIFGVYFSWLKIEHLNKNINKYKKWMKLIAGAMLILIALYFIIPII